MKNRKLSKLAVLASVMSLVMCCTMLLGGGTFAWFTDSVSSDVNTIQSGNLDIELEYKKPGDTEWKAVEADTKIFAEDALWEPGYTETVALRIKNNGSLDVKYQASLNILEEQAGHRVGDGASFNLSDFLKITTVGPQAGNEIGEMLVDVVLSSRENTAAFLSASFGEPFVNNNNENEHQIDAGDDPHVLIVRIQMPTTVGNEANHNGDGHNPYINFGLNVIATQAASESDAFDNQYDADATYTQEEPLANIVTIDVPEQSMYIVEDITSGFNGENTYVELEKAFTFEATETGAQAATGEYAEWFVDFYVSVNEPVEDGIIMAGQYDAFNPSWFGFNVPAGDYTTPTPLLGTVTGGISNWTYAEIIGGVGTFNCGVLNTNENNNGKIMTVELRMINNENTEEYKTINRIDYVLE